jgi:hypothetical protein
MFHRELKNHEARLPVVSCRVMSVFVLYHGSICSLAILTGLQNEKSKMKRIHTRTIARSRYGRDACMRIYGPMGNSQGEAGKEKEGVKKRARVLNQGGKKLVSQ